LTAPAPAPDLASREPEFVVDAGALVERFHDGKFDPIHFDRGRLGRLNAPDGRYGVLYVAANLRGAFAETFLRTPGRTLLPLDLIGRKARTRLRVTRALKLLKLGGFGLARVGATAEVTHAGLPYNVP
jgi:hypothetical protein